MNPRIACLLLLLGCAKAPTLTDAAALMALELARQPHPHIRVVLDVDTREIFVNGSRSGRLGSCATLPDGGRELTIYVARHDSVEQLGETIYHEMTHALMSCTEADHSEIK